MHTVLLLENLKSRAKYFMLTMDVSNRIGRLIGDLSSGYCKNKELQKDFDTLGYKSFSIHTIAQFHNSVDARKKLESVILEARNSGVQVYNYTHKLPMRKGSRSY